MSTQTEIATQANITQGHLSKILTGKRRPSYKTAKRIAEATSTSPILWLEGDKDEIKAAISGNRDYELTTS